MTDQEFRDRFPRYKRTIFINEAEQKCLDLYKKHGHIDNTHYTTAVPYTTIGSYDFLRIQLRYTSFYGQEPSWGFSVNAIAGEKQVIDFNSCQEAFLAALEFAKIKIEKLDADIEQAHKDWANRKHNHK